MKNNYIIEQVFNFQKANCLAIGCFLGFLLLSINFIKATNVLTDGGVSGTVTNIKGDPIPGATVQLLNTKFAVVTDENGKFDFKNVPVGNYKLRISFIGFLNQDKDIEISNVPQTLDLSLAEDIFKLQEVLVTGGNALKKVESSVAITTLKNEINLCQRFLLLSRSRGS